MATYISNGISKGKDGYHAANEAAKQAKEKFKGENIDAALVFSSLEYHMDCVYNGIKEAIGEIPVIGATSAGEFTEEEAMKGSVAICLIGSDTHKFFIHSKENVSDNIYEVIKEIKDKSDEEIKDFPHKSAIVFMDGLSGHCEDIVTKMSRIMDPDVDFAGGAAGDDLKFKATYVMHNGKVLHDGLAVMMIGSNKPIGMGVQHGHKPISDKLEITKAKDNILYRVNGRPAWDVWKDAVRELAKKEHDIDVDALETVDEKRNVLILYELGISLGNDAYIIRAPLGVNDDGSLVFQGPLQDGASFFITHTVEGDQLSSTKRAAEIAKQKTGDEAIAGALVFDCAVRYIILQDKFFDAVKGMSEVIGDNVPLTGFETYGEVCKTQNNALSGYHNTTSVVVLIPD